MFKISTFYDSTRRAFVVVFYGVTQLRQEYVTASSDLFISILRKSVINLFGYSLQFSYKLLKYLL